MGLRALLNISLLSKKKTLFNAFYGVILREGSI
jgi:hypothetical protein